MDWITDDFSVILMLEDGPRKVGPSDTIGMLYEAPEVIAGYLEIRCTNCDTVQLAYGDFQRVATYERNMGKEYQYITHHWVECLKCESELDAKVEYHEYPRGVMQPTQIELIRNVEYQPVRGISMLVSDVQSMVEDRRNLRNELNELSELVRAYEAGISDTPFFKFLGAIDEVTNAIEDFVLILGPYGTGSEKLLYEVKTELEDAGYDAYLVKDLPDLEDKSLEINILLFMGLARFCIMVDSEPSGHIAEHKLAEKHNVILARLYPESGGSSWMIRDDEVRDIPHLEPFEYQGSPLDVLDDAIEWAEETYDDLSGSYQSYPWR